MSRLALGLLLVLGAPVVGHAQEKPTPAGPPPNLRPRELLARLAEPIDTTDFADPMSLKDALGLLYERGAARKVEVPILVNMNAFKEVNPEGASPYDAQVRLPNVPRQMRLGQVLRLLISQIPTNQIPANNATYLVRPGFVEITTAEKATAAFLLQQRVQVRFEKRPLGAALDDLFDLTGVSVVVDVRHADKMATPVSATLSNEVTLGTALRVLTDMAGLRPLAVGNVIIITSPTDARAWEDGPLWQGAVPQRVGIID